MKTKVCEHCQKPLTKSGRRFCSRACSGAHIVASRPIRVCKHCGDVYRAPKSERAFFCSRACFDASRLPGGTCKGCGGPIHERRLTYCSIHCRRNHLASRADDAQWLLDSGEPADRIPERLGLKAEALARSLDRYGYTDLARPFYRVARRERRAA